MASIGDGRGASGSEPGDTNLDIVALIAVCWRAKWLVIALALVFSVLSIFYARMTPPVYNVSMVVGPTDEPSTSNPLTALQSRLLTGTLAGSGGEAALLNRFEETISLDVVAERVVKRGPFLQRLFPGQWDAASHSWRERRGWAAPITEFLFGPSIWQPPTAERLGQYLRSNLQLTPLGRSQLMRLSLEGEDPVLLKDLLTTAGEETDGLLRDEEGRILQMRNDYLQARLQAVSIADLRKVFTDLLIDVERKLMTVQSGMPYSSVVVEEPHVPDHPVRPNRVIIVLSGTALGAGLGCSLALLRAILRSRRPGVRVRAGGRIAEPG
jgi:uncharacterized protein involved in exopolysaccharide biosynthesis